MKKKDIGIRLGNSTASRSIYFHGLVVLVFALLGLRMFYLQVYQEKKYKYLSERNRVKFRRIDAPRGNIYDSRNELLVTNGAGYRLVYLNERKIDEKTLKEISQLTGYDEEYIAKRVKYGEIFPYTRENVLIEDLDPHKALKIMEKLSDYPYLQVQTYSKRKYFFDTLASHVLGYVKKISVKEYEELKDKGYTPRDKIGKEGVEKIYDEDLQGKDGYDYIEVNALNRAQKIIRNQPPVSGQDLHLTLDMRLQRYMENVFKEGKYTGAFIALEAKTGKVITMVSYPNYSLTTFSSQISYNEWNKILHDPRRPLSNKAISGEYPPGSTFKPFVAFSFLKDGLDPNFKIFDNGYYQIGKWKWRAWKRGGHGYVDMKKSIVESVNPYYYKFADDYGYEGMVNVTKSFGFGKDTGIDVSGEKSGVLPTPEWKKKTWNQGWFKGDTINMSIGQGYVLTSPMQVAVAYSILANRGVAYKPHVVDYLERDGKKEYIKPEVLYKVNYPASYYRIMNDAMEGVVDLKDGTGKVLRTPGLEIAAKSGSAQNSRYEKTHAWIAGYFPAKNPQIVFTVLLEGAGGGGSEAGPVAKKFIDKYLEYYGKEN